ncbi:MAG: hypothetical protein AB1758_19740, partial [Candidatus Eremiobacterota bacterium]
RRALARYSLALLYTDPGWCDPMDDLCGFPLPGRVVYTGVVARPPALPAPGRVVVGLTGAGAGGHRLFSWLIESLRGKAPLRLVLGPLFDASGYEGIPGVEIRRTGSVEESLDGAAAVVARAGYNTAYTLAQSDLPVVFVPLDTPESGREQRERAGRLAGLDGIWSLSEGALDAAVLEQALAWKGQRRLPFRVEGADEAARFLLEAA